MALNLQNAKEKFINALFGVPTEIEQAEGNVQYQYPTQRQADFMQGLPNNKDLLGKIQASPYNQGYTDQEIINRVAQGQNFGLPQLASEQKEWGIKLPRANNELDEEAVRGNYLNVYQPKLEIGTATTPRQGGLFNDLAQGFQENATQGFNVQNLAPDQNKGLATRIGEGLGTLTRFANSPLGRGLIAYGTTRALGYDDPVEQGLIAGVTRQGNISRDKAYRQGLINMGVDEAQVNAIPGIVSDEIFTNFARAKQMQDNAEYRNMMLQNQQAQNELMNQYRQDQLNYQRMQDIQDRAMKEREFNYRASQDAFDNKIALANLEAKQQGAQGKPLSDTQVKDIKNLTDSLNDVDRIITKYSNTKYDTGFGVLGAARRNPLTSKFDPLATEMRQDIDLFKKTVAKAREGGRLTDQDQKYYEKALLNPNLTREDFLALAREFEDTVKLQRDTALDMYELQGKNVSNFRNYYENKTNSTKAQTGKYKEGQTATNPKTGAKMIYRGGTWQAL